MNAIKSAVLTLILRFVDRQQIAFDALLVLRPHFLTEYTGRTSPKPRWRRAPQRGRWGDWDYFVHGLGIELIHRVTREPIEWDTPDTSTFDRYWFVNYVAWLLDQACDDQAARIVQSHLAENGESLRTMLFRILDHLVAIGVLENCLNKYTVLY